MKTYSVQLLIEPITVHAEDEEEATDIAEELMKEGKCTITGAEVEEEYYE